MSNERVLRQSFLAVSISAHAHLNSKFEAPVIRTAVFLWLAMALCLANSAHAQQNVWVDVNGPFGGAVVDMIEVNGVLYAAAGGVYRSTDQGASWSATSDLGKTTPHSEINITLLAKDSYGGVIAVGGYDTYRSTDRGASWHPLTATSLGATSIAVGPDNSIYRVAFGSVHRLKHRASFSQVVATGGRTPIVAVAVAPDAKIYAISSAYYTLRSDDNGDSWVIVNAGDSSLPSATSLTVLSNGDLVATSSQGLITSRDGGATWLRDETNIRERTTTRVIEHGGELFVGTKLFGAFRSNGHGATWTEITPGLENPNVWSLLGRSDGTLFAGTARGIQVSTDRGSTWRDASRGLLSIRAQSLMTKGNDVYVATGTGMFKSVDLGATWSPVDYGLVDRDITLMAVDSSGAVLAMSRTGTLFRSENDGGEWIRAGSVDAKYVWALTVTYTGDLLLMGGETGVNTSTMRRSTDRGATWTVLPLAIQAYGLAVATDGSLIGLTSHDGIYRSVTNGSSWAQVAAPPSVPLIAIAVDRMGGVYVGGSRTLMRSTNNGVSWTTLLGYGVDELVATRKGTVYASVSNPSNTTLTSRNQGTSWSTATSGLNGRALRGMRATMSGVVFSGTSRGGLVRTADAISATPESPSGAAGIALHAPTPHPVRDRATITFSVHAPSTVRVSLHDVRGGDVAVLHNGVANPGTHAVGLDARSLAPGVYICRLLVGAESRSQLVVIE